MNRAITVKDAKQMKRLLALVSERKFPHRKARPLVLALACSDEEHEQILKAMKEWDV
jgi:hypothetical protein